MNYVDMVALQSSQIKFDASANSSKTLLRNVRITEIAIFQQRLGNN
jgi:hypothetical protein